MKVCLSEFGQRLKKLRHAKKLSGYDVARIVDVSQACVCIWERGNGTPRDADAILAAVEAAPDGLGLRGRPSKADAVRRALHIDHCELAMRIISVHELMAWLGARDTARNYAPTQKVLKKLIVSLKRECVTIAKSKRRLKVGAL